MFQINLEKSPDPAAGEADVFPQEIARVLLNLISNGFYAATKRKEQDSSVCYEPTLKASTKNLGDCVEVIIWDNGTGIPPEVREKMFNRPNLPERALALACDQSRHHRQATFGVYRG
jgi:signal transduction histidine kinase